MSFRKRIGLSVLASLAACAPRADEAARCAAPDALEAPAKVPPGLSAMGAGALYPEEAGRGAVRLAGFLIDRTEVTNARFAAFAEETGYVTLAERMPDPALHPGIPPEALVPGSAVFVMAGGDRAGFWRFEPGAFWRAPEGPGSSIEDRMDHPVVHLAYEDAARFAAWAGGRLPSEAEWEHAARGGLAAATYEWGETAPDDLPSRRANTWQGVFPVIDTGADGYKGTAPVACYAPNGYGLHDATGNVWEWTADADPARNRGVIKGGSYLCAENYCRRYRPAARHPQELDFSTSHLGFRVAYDLPADERTRP